MQGRRRNTPRGVCGTVAALMSQTMDLEDRKFLAAAWAVVLLVYAIESFTALTSVGIMQ